MNFRDPLIEQYRSFHPHTFSYVEKILLLQETSEDSGMSLTLTVDLLSDTFEKNNLRLTFYGVANLKIHIMANCIQLQDIQIVSLHDRQWEDLKYEVTHTDKSQLSFFCRSFMVELVDKEQQNIPSDSES